MFKILGFLFSLLKGIYNTCAIHTQVKKQAGVARLLLAGYNTISQFNNSDIETPDEFANSEPSPSTFSQPPFQPIHYPVKIELLSLPLPFHMLQPYVFPFD